jgi:hypothetical protein
MSMSEDEKSRSLVDCAAQGPDKSAPDQTQLVEGEDFYYENGFMVFSEKYLLARGYCCQSGCRHCPYGTPSEDF